MQFMSSVSILKIMKHENYFEIILYRLYLEGFFSLPAWYNIFIITRLIKYQMCTFFSF